jgi:hypothetical protein
MFFYELAFAPRQHLVDILNAGESWRTFGGMYIVGTDCAMDILRFYL